MANRIAPPTNAVTNAGTVIDQADGAIGGAWVKSTSGAANAVISASLYRYGTQSIYMTVEALSGSFVYVTQTLGAAKDFSKYTHLGVSMYLESVYRGSEMTTGFQLFMSTDSGSFTNYYSLAETLCPAIKPGWNFMTIALSAFSSNGAPSWSNINTIRIRLNGSNTQAKALYYDGIISGVRCRPKVSFTFDDSVDTSYSIAYAYTQPKGVKLTHFAIGDYLSDPAQSGRTSLAELKTMVAGGDELCVHGPHLTDRWDINPTAIASSISSLRGKGLSPLLHGAYPNGEFGQTQSTSSLSIAQVFALMAQNQMISGRTTTPGITVPGSLAGAGSPYAIRGASLGSATSLATAKAMVDSAIAAGGYQIFTLHQLDVTASSATTWATADFQALVDYCIARRAMGLIDICTYSQLVSACCLDSYQRAEA